MFLLTHTHFNNKICLENNYLLIKIMYYTNNTSIYLINVCIITVIWKQKADYIASGTSLREMAKQPGFTAYPHQSESQKAKRAASVLLPLKERGMVL